MKYTKREKEYYNKHREVACQRLGITINQYNYLRRKGEALRLVFENNCNGYYADEATYNLAVNSVKMAIWQYGLKHNNVNALKSYIQTDPRGSALYLDINPIEKNAYTNAVCIY